MSQVISRVVSQRAPLRRLAVTALVLAVSVTSSAAFAASAGPLVPPPPADDDRVFGDHLTVIVRDAGQGADGTFELYCHPAGGTHPDPSEACRALERNARWGTDTFAPVPDGSVCTMRYGGPATAHVTGRWAGRPVDATFDRADGCRIERWDRFVPLLPAVGGQTPAMAGGAGGRVP
ncbi:SSI family serine proteinase inhibitor [Streptomyces sp. NPDC002134]|uniref:SSI family serine proteinase inhibitor n=1 Tax=Streptomyces sp. NPDC002134 TaxID=3364632 RepID=UPI00367379AD